jgi:hypothetical protein
VNIQNLGKYENVSAGVRNRVGIAYEKLAGSDDYQKNSNSLRIIQIAVVSLSAIATGYTNAIIHENRLGFWGAHGLAILVAFFVERFYFVLRHGLTTTYQSDKQRLYALLCYRIIQATMILNCAILTMWIAELPVPPWLEFWNHWSLCVHFGLALLGVQSVRDSDAACDFQKWMRLYKSRCDYTEENATEATLFECREEVTVNLVVLTSVKMSPGRIHFCE